MLLIGEFQRDDHCRSKFQMGKLKTKPKPIAQNDRELRAKPKPRAKPEIYRGRDLGRGFGEPFPGKFVKI